MRLLANENVSATVIRVLRQRGHDVLSAKESMRGESDPAVLLRARQEGRLVVTHDKDFGELAFRNQLPAECGILLFRLGGADPDSDNRRMLEVIQGRQDWAGHFAVVTDNQIRIRPLPPAKTDQ
jgi:predicted nuclease of predicted toxin-antitoxin system